MDDAIFNCVIPVDAQPVYGSAELPAELVGRFMGEEAENVRRVEAATGARFSVDDTGLVRIFAPSRKQYDAAVEAVKEAEGANILQGLTYRVRVVRLQDYAAFVQLPNGMEHVLHISQLSHTKVRDISEAVAVGDEFDVLCVGRDAKGNALLSRKALLPKPVPPEQQAPPAASAPASSSQPPPAAAEAAAARVSS